MTRDGELLIGQDRWTREWYAYLDLIDLNIEPISLGRNLEENESHLGKFKLY